MRNSTSLISIGSVLWISLSLLGCNGSSSATADPAQGSAKSSSDSGDVSQNMKAKVSLDEALSPDIQNHRAECRGKNKNQICVQICHRPPGNPANSKNMILPLKASLAHLSHGGPHHAEKDYLGLCQPEDCTDDGDEDEVIPEEEDSVDNDSPSEEPEVIDDPVVTIPQWCELHYDVDNDCDGFDDVTHESLY